MYSNEDKDVMKDSRLTRYVYVSLRERMEARIKRSKVEIEQAQQDIKEANRILKVLDENKDLETTLNLLQQT